MSAAAHAVKKQSGRGEVRRVHDILTPEGVPLEFEIASGGDRAIAFILDMLIITVISVALALLATFAMSGGWLGGWLGALLILVLFGLRSFYFIVFELRWQGATPGKRYVGLRVIDREGGPLRGEAIFARNLMREVEVFLPLAAILAPDQLWPGAGGLFYAVAISWFVILALMPLFNRKRLRVGDLVGGTIVVRSPKAVLLPDLAERKVEGTAQSATREPAYSFTHEQLDLYGIYELQVLEEVLRGGDPPKLEAVAATICAKIGWDEPPRDTRDFLEHFYTAQRARLEQKMLLGKRQDFKQPGEKRIGRRIR